MNTTATQLLTREEAAAMLKLDRDTLAHWAMTGLNLPVVKIGPRTVRYRLSDIEKFIESRIIGAHTK